MDTHAEVEVKVPVVGPEFLDLIEHLEGLPDWDFIGTENVTDYYTEIVPGISSTRVRIGGSGNLVTKKLIVSDPSGNLVRLESEEPCEDSYLPKVVVLARDNGFPALRKVRMSYKGMVAGEITTVCLDVVSIRKSLTGNVHTTIGCFVEAEVLTTEYSRIPEIRDNLKSWISEQLGRGVEEAPSWSQYVWENRIIPG